MFNRHLVRAVRNTAVFAALAAASSIASAAPYFITYTGTVASSRFPEVNDGESYTATLVFDNGGVTAASQTWNTGDLTCAIWTANDAGDVRFAHDLTSQGALDNTGSVTTDGGGSLSANFSLLSADPVDPGTYTSTGAVISDSVAWYMNDANGVFFSDSFNVDWDDAAGGVQMNIANWSNPAPYSGNCNVSSQAAVEVPVMPLWILATLGALLGGLGVRKLRTA
jgi:hypothetical protein